MNYLSIEAKPASKSSLLKRKPIFDVFVNDAPFNTSRIVDGVRINHEGYQAWIHMIHRCYGASVRKYPTYSGVRVSENWHSFMCFREWWQSAYVPGWCLDKDILGDGSIYSPSTCMYIPQALNKLLNTKSRFRGEQPLGVTLYKGRYRAAVSNPVTQKHEFLGDYDTPEEAHMVWLAAKHQIVDELKSTFDAVHPRMYSIVKRKINRLR
jgi:hypothetical protein